MAFSRTQHHLILSPKLGISCRVTLRPSMFSCTLSILLLGSHCPSHSYTVHMWSVEYFTSFALTSSENKCQVQCFHISYFPIRAAKQPQSLALWISRVVSSPGHSNAGRSFSRTPGSSTESFSRGCEVKEKESPI